MKHMRKIATLLLALAMILSMATSVFAETEVGASEVADAYTITVPNNGHVYEIYQIFTGDLSGGVLSNIKWGANGTGTLDEAVAEEVLDELTALTTSTDGYNRAENLDTILKYVDLTSDPHAIAPYADGEETVYSVSVPAGYYLVKDQADSIESTENDAYTTYIVKVVNNVVINPKADTPEVDKLVKDVNDTTGESAWGETADYDIGDEMSFKLVATLPSNYPDYDSYKLIFSDTFVNMENITINKVYGGWNTGSIITGRGDPNFVETTDYTVDIDENAGSFTVTFADLKATNVSKTCFTGEGNTYTYTVVIEYTAVLSETAVSGSAGNANGVKLTYSNDPNVGASGSTGETPEDQVLVFTYDMIVNKVDGDNAPLDGAMFELYKKDSTGVYNLVDTVAVSGDDNNVFTWKGLDDGDYKLVESVTPAGYNTIADIEFTITAEHDDALTDLSTTFAGATVDAAAGSITTTVQNQAGSTLPSTGGIGTTIFYILGGALVLVAVVLLVTKRRMAQAR